LFGFQFAIYFQRVFGSTGDALIDLIKRTHPTRTPRLCRHHELGQSVNVLEAQEFLYLFVLGGMWWLIEYPLKYLLHNIFSIVLMIVFFDLVVALTGKMQRREFSGISKLRQNIYYNQIVVVGRMNGRRWMQIGLHNGSQCAIVTTLRGLQHLSQSFALAPQWRILFFRGKRRRHDPTLSFTTMKNGVLKWDGGRTL
jgi:hypothetical protein